MDKIKTRTLRPWEKHKLKAMKRQKTNSVNCLHARIIFLSRGGLHNRQIGTRCGCTPTWVREIIHRFNRGGIDAIIWYPYYCARAGPRKFLADVVEQIGEVALSPPKRLIGMGVWSLQKLRAYLTEQKIISSISLEWLRQLLRRRRIRWRHSKSWKDSDDPQFWPKYRRIRRLYGKRPRGGRRICVDEFGPLNLQPRHGKHYARIGHVDRHRATYSRTGGVRYMFGAYDMERDTLVGVFAAKHKIKFYWTPTNASWLNRIESHFTALRKFALDNTDYRSHEQQQEAIDTYLRWRNRARHISLENWKSYRRSQKRAA